MLSSRSAEQLIRRAVQDDRGTGRQQAIDLLDSLTARERDVARGVASGATNHEIGARLHISPGTVKTHLEQVFVKLGVRRRGQVGTILERAGLGATDA